MDTLANENDGARREGGAPRVDGPADSHPSEGPRGGPRPAARVRATDPPAPESDPGRGAAPSCCIGGIVRLPVFCGWCKRTPEEVGETRRDAYGALCLGCFAKPSAHGWGGVPLPAWFWEWGEKVEEFRRCDCGTAPENASLLPLDRDGLPYAALLEELEGL